MKHGQGTPLCGHVAFAAAYPRSMTRGEEAEARVAERLRAALPEPEFHVYTNVRWTGPVRARGPARDGEADAVIAHPEHGVLVLEVKSGTAVPGPGRALVPRARSPSTGRPSSRPRTASTSWSTSSVDLPDWPPDLDPLAGHAVAFPDVDLASLPRGHALLGLDAPTDLVLDATALEIGEGSAAGSMASPRSGPATARAADGRWARRASRSSTSCCARPSSLHRLVRGRIEDDRAELVAREPGAVAHPRTSRSRSGARRSSVRPAAASRCWPPRRRGGSPPRATGRCSCASTSASRRACSATWPMRRRAECLEVTTFHRLCELLGGAAGALPTRPEPLPAGLVRRDAARRRSTPPSARTTSLRYHAIVVDEGQDFALGLARVAGAAAHRPGAGRLLGLPRPSAGAPSAGRRRRSSSLARLELFEDHRNPPSVGAAGGALPAWRGRGRDAAPGGHAGRDHRGRARAPRRSRRCAGRSID